MARIRIVDEWRRSPVAEVTRARAVMVVAATWAEQKVLMRSYASAKDQTRPAIVLQGDAVAVGPAGVDPHGPWGIHVDQQREGRAQELREALEEAARRLAGTTGTPPRLMDEESDFEKRTTNYWQPGSPRDRQSQGGLRHTPAEPIPAAALPGEVPAPAAAPAEDALPSPAQAFAAHPNAKTIQPFGPSEPIGAPPPPSQADGCPSAPRPRRNTPTGWGAPVPNPTASAASSSTHGSQPRHYTPVPVTSTLSHMVARTLPLGFRLENAERSALDLLGQGSPVPAGAISALVGVDDGATWMVDLMEKLARHGLDIVVRAEDKNGEPTFELRR